MQKKVSGREIPGGFEMHQSIHTVEDLKATFSIIECGDQRANGLWDQHGTHDQRPQYQKIGDAHTWIYWNTEHQAWNLYFRDTAGMPILHRSTVNQKTVPTTGWLVVAGMLHLHLFRSIGRWSWRKEPRGQSWALVEKAAA